MREGQQAKSFLMGGGLVLNAPALATPAGAVLAALNHESAARGYSRIGGYERYDGRPQPSRAGYWVLPFRAGTQQALAGQRLEGITSGAAGDVLLNALLSTGSYGGGDARGRLVLTNVTGTFAPGEPLRVATTTIATADGAAVRRGSTNDTDDRDWQRLAVTTARNSITAVPGSGPVRGVWVYKSEVYAVRNNLAGTAGVLHKATASGWAVQSSALPAGGKYRFVNHNFYGGADRVEMFGVNGVGQAFRWDGSTLAFIGTGMAVDRPTHIAVYRNHLFLAFPGGSLQNSATGNPLSWTPITGASEIGIGEEITGLVDSASTAMVIFGRNKVCVLAGDDSNNFTLSTLADDAGAVADTVQLLGRPLYMDDGGLRDMQTTSAFGDWRLGTLTQMVEPWLAAKKAAGIAPVASLRVRAKDQYRVFYGDGTGLSVYFGRKLPEVMPFDLKKTVQCTCSGEDAAGNEILLFGADDGFVYRLDAGTSFDGQPITAWLRLPFNHAGSPNANKRWHKLALELDTLGQLGIGVTADFSYGDPGQPSMREQSFTVAGGGGFWNESNWDGFVWSAPVHGMAEAHLDGLGTSISPVVFSESAWDAPYTLHGYTLNWSNRRMVR